MSQLTPQNTVTLFGSDTAQHLAQVNKWAALGFRSTSLTIYGDPTNPTFGAVMVNRPNFVAEWQVLEPCLVTVPLPLCWARMRSRALRRPS